MEQTVGEVASAVGVSVRTLHHWEQVGLVQPSGRFANGYRAYGEADVDRVRSVIAWRELGLSLEDIRTLLHDGVSTEQLEQHREALREQGARLRQTLGAVERALEARRMGIELDPGEIRDVFGQDDPTQHAAEAAERWGDTDAYRESHRRTSSYRKEDWVRMRAQQDDLEQRMASAMAAGEDGRELAEEHRQLISTWFYDCPAEVHLGLAEMYVADERFTAHYDRRAPGLAQWLRNAIVARHADH